MTTISLVSRDEIEAALVELGPTEEEVVGSLRRMGIKGQREEGTCCVIANYLSGRFRNRGVTFNVDLEVVEVSGGARDTSEWMRHEPHVASLIERFDEGQYPDLVTEDEE